MNVIGINARTFSVDNPGGAIQVGLKLTKTIRSASSSEVKLYGSPSLQNKFPNSRIHSQFYSSESQLYGIFWERAVLPFYNHNDIDVLLCPNGNGPPFELDVPVILYIHDVNAMLGYSSTLYEYYRKATVPVAARAADAIVTVSKFSKSEITDVLGIPDEKVHVVHNGLDPQYIHDRDGHQIDVPENYVLYIGQLNPRKNIQALINGFKKFNKKSGMDYKLVLVGPKNRTIFKNFKLESAPDVVHLGYVSDEELKYIYDQSNVFLFPSLHEGFGLPPLEAMACDTPVVASRAGALPEVLEDYPIYVDPHSEEDISRGLSSALLENEYSATRREEARRHARSFTWVSSVADLEEVVDEVTT